MKYLCLLLFSVVFIFSCRKPARKENKEANPYYDRAFEYREQRMADSAYLYFNKAKDLFLIQKDSLGAGKCLVNMSLIALDKGDNFGSQELSLTAIGYFDHKNEGQFVYITSNYNNLGMATHNLRDFEGAIRFYDLAIKFSRDSLNILIDQNNKAIVYKDMKAYRVAISLYDSIINKFGDHQQEYARTLTNRAYTKWLQDPRYNAVPDLLRALVIRKEIKDLWGQNASYTHLVQYYADRPGDSALFYAKQQYQLAKEIHSPDDQLHALRELVKYSPAQETKRYFLLHQQLSDSLEIAHWNDKNQFALIRYETEKHKAEAQKAQTENVKKKNSLLIGYIIVVVLLSVLLFLYLWFRKRNRLLLQEKELEVKNTELKYVKKIHDRVANKVYHLMSEVENTNGFSRDVLLDKLEALYDTSRDISYESDEPAGEGNYATHISSMLQSYSSASTEVLIVGNDEELWQDVADLSRSELFIVMQELMTNMKKHSSAQRVVIKFQRHDSFITVSYSDNGVGMQDAPQKNGLQNTGNRINHIGGTITFESILERGLEIAISFPIV